MLIWEFSIVKIWIRNIFMASKSPVLYIALFVDSGLAELDGIQ